MAGIVIKPRSRIFHGHDWVYSSEVKKIFGDPKPGDTISLKDFKDRPLGTAIYNPDSQIVARRISRRTQGLDHDFFTRRLERAKEYRQQIGFASDAPQRVVWSESDGLPGVIVDRYGSVAVMQTLTLGMDLQKETLAEAIKSTLGVTTVVERNDNSIRKAEGMELVSGVLLGETPDAVIVDTGGISMETNLLEGQKTGLYLDQFGNYAAVAQHAAGRRVLDCFSNQGGFALHCAKAGASEVSAIDISASATTAVAANAARNALTIKAVTANVFDFLKDLPRPQGGNDAESTYDFIILDPPSFTKSKKKLNDALRGYKEIHLRALQLLAPGGKLATFCCSHHVSNADFRKVICAAAVDAKRTLREITTYRQREDHPIIPTLPETEYLKGHLFEVLPAW